MGSVAGSCNMPGLPSFGMSKANISLVKLKIELKDIFPWVEGRFVPSSVFWTKLFHTSVDEVEPTIWNPSAWQVRHNFVDLIFQPVPKGTLLVRMHIVPTLDNELLLSAGGCWSDLPCVRYHNPRGGEILRRGWKILGWACRNCIDLLQGHINVCQNFIGL